MREVRVRYPLDVLRTTVLAPYVALFSELDLLNTLGRSDDDAEVTLLVRMRLADGVDEAAVEGLPNVSLQETVRRDASDDGLDLYVIASLRHPHLTLPLRLPDAAVTGFSLRENGISITIRGSSDGCSTLVTALRLWDNRCSVSVGRTSGDEDTGSAPLTEQQRHAAHLSISMGYHEVPRRCTLAEVAQAAGVSTATMSGHLREVNRIAHEQLLERLGE